MFGQAMRINTVDELRKRGIPKDYYSMPLLVVTSADINP